jgi:hypothetical protein
LRDLVITQLGRRICHPWPPDQNLPERIPQVKQTTKSNHNSRLLLFDLP